MRYTFEEEFRLDHPETVGETDRHFDLDNYKDWLEVQLIEARKQLPLYNAIGSCEWCGTAKKNPNGNNCIIDKCQNTPQKDCDLCTDCLTNRSWVIM